MQIQWRGENRQAERVGLELIDLRGQDEVAFGKTVHLVSPDGDFGFAPRQQNVGMVSLFLSNRSYAIHEVEGLLTILEFETARQVVIVDHVPVRQLVAEVVELVALESGNIAS